MSVHQVIVNYQEHQRTKGNREQSIQSSGHALCRFFASALDKPLAWLTPARCAVLYDRLRDTLAVDTHRNYLAQARSCLTWAVKQGWLRVSPLAELRGVGKRQRGKSQLRIDEGRRLYRACLELGAAGDDGAVAVAVALVMGLRASEITTRTARDVDDAGRVLWIDDNAAEGFAPKTDASRRPVNVPCEIQPLLADRCRGKRPNGLLFPSENGGAHWRDWVSEQSRRLCKKAGVPEVCAHSLRGFVATAAIQAGAVPELVAQLLGHSDISTTLGAYAKPGAAQAQRQERGLTVIRGGRAAMN